ncbi:MAG: electron transfer flavoprotein subunit beta/FixA family protein [Deltaproteobacteria bacterium]|nr:electron transfer flavoprotein subunit beta/FixA family protein [Deltaproteobacteria bacterium]
MGLKILVAIKHVIDVELNIKVKDGQLDLEGLQYVMSAWDENAVEEAVALKESHDAETVVISIGSDDATVSIRKAFAMGIDAGIHVSDPNLRYPDSLTVAKIINGVRQDKNFDLILLGRQAQDTDNGLTAGLLAEIADLPFVANATKIEVIDEKKLKVTRQADIGKEVIELSLPAVISVNDSINEPRLASLKGIMQAKKKTIETMDAGLLGIDSGEASLVEVMEFLPPVARAQGQKFDGDAQEITEKVVGLLINEAKVL